MNKEFDIGVTWELVNASVDELVFLNKETNQKYIITPVTVWGDVKEIVEKGKEINGEFSHKNCEWYDEKTNGCLNYWASSWLAWDLSDVDKCIDEYFF